MARSWVLAVALPGDNSLYKRAVSRQAQASVGLVPSDHKSSPQDFASINISANIAMLQAK